MANVLDFLTNTYNKAKSKVRSQLTTKRGKRARSKTKRVRGL